MEFEWHGMETEWRVKENERKGQTSEHRTFAFIAHMHAFFSILFFPLQSRAEDAGVSSSSFFIFPFFPCLTFVFVFFFRGCLSSPSMDGWMVNNLSSGSSQFVGRWRCNRMDD